MTLRLRLQYLGVQLGLLLLLLVWWRWANDGRVSPVLLPDLGALVSHIPEVLARPRTLIHVRVTFFEVLSAAAFSISTGLTVGFLVGRSTYLTKLLEPVFGWFQTVPIILIYPMCVLLFGLGSASKIAFAAIYGFFPVVLNTIRGLQYVDARFLRAARSLGATETQLTWQVRMPAARPLVMAGIRMGSVLNMIGVLAGQILASIRGVGYEITNSAQNFLVLDLYAHILLALAIAVFFNMLVTKAEDKNLVLERAG